MDENQKYQEMYQKLMEYEHGLHIQNQKRIKIGKYCIFAIPIVFLILLFAVQADSNEKLIFLVLWIASLFGIAIYLVVVEYVDHNLQKKMKEVVGNSEGGDQE